MIDDGGPAFPVDSMTAHAILTDLGIKRSESGYSKALALIARGITMRDYFAAKALVALLALAERDDTFKQNFIFDTAEAAYQFADAMIVARES